MSKMIQIRNVPDELHREAKMRAARAGMSLSDYLLREVRRILQEAEIDEIMARLETREPVYPSESPVEAIRAEREAR